jgi:hypothetical protein
MDFYFLEIKYKSTKPYLKKVKQKAEVVRMLSLYEVKRKRARAD